MSQHCRPCPLFLALLLVSGILRGSPPSNLASLSRIESTKRRDPPQIASFDDEISSCQAIAFSSPSPASISVPTPVEQSLSSPIPPPPAVSHLEICPLPTPPATPASTFRIPETYRTPPRFVPPQPLPAASPPKSVSPTSSNVVVPDPRFKNAPETAKGEVKFEGLWQSRRAFPYHFPTVEEEVDEAASAMARLMLGKGCEMELDRKPFHHNFEAPSSRYSPGERRYHRHQRCAARS